MKDTPRKWFRTEVKPYTNDAWALYIEDFGWYVHAICLATGELIYAPTVNGLP